MHRCIRGKVSAKRKDSTATSYPTQGCWRAGSLDQKAGCAPRVGLACSVEDRPGWTPCHRSEGLGNALFSPLAPPSPLPLFLSLARFLFIRADEDFLSKREQIVQDKVFRNDFKCDENVKVLPMQVQDSTNKSIRQLPNRKTHV